MRYCKSRGELSCLEVLIDDVGDPGQERERTVEDARRFYAETASAYMMGRSAPYAEGLLFRPAEDGAGDPDEAIIAGAMARQTVEKVKDVLTGREGLE